jgi:thiol:disulfide interchange protein
MSSNGPAKRSRQPLFALAAVVAAAIVLGALWITSHRSASPNNPSEDHQASQLAAPTPNQPRGDIYPDGAGAASDVANALTRAAREHKRVILDFGGNWCGDCHVLDIYFHDASNLALLNANYVLVHINVGKYDQNLDLAAKYGVPLAKGVPALVVLSPDGQVLLSQRHGEFEAMRKLDSSAVTEFLNKWKG